MILNRQTLWHWGAQWWVLAAAGTLHLHLVSAVVGSEKPAGVGGALAVAWLIVSSIHDRSHCGRCSNDRLDGALEAERRRGVLAFNHRRVARVGAVGVIVMYFTAAWRPLVWSQDVTEAVAIYGAAGYHWAHRWHDRLRPWCPWCRRGRGGDDPVLVPPTPVGGTSRG